MVYISFTHLLGKKFNDLWTKFFKIGHSAHLLTYVVEISYADVLWINRVKRDIFQWRYTGAGFMCLPWLNFFIDALLKYTWLDLFKPLCVPVEITTQNYVLT